MVDIWRLRGPRGTSRELLPGPCVRRATSDSRFPLRRPPWQRVGSSPASPLAVARAARSDEAVVAPRGPFLPRLGRPGRGLVCGWVPPRSASAPPSPAPWGRCPRAPAAHAASPLRRPPLSPRPPFSSQDVAQRGADPAGVRGHAADRPAADGVR